MFANDIAFEPCTCKEAKDIITRFFFLSAKGFGLKINIRNSEMLCQPVICEDKQIERQSLVKVKDLGKTFI